MMVDVGLRDAIAATIYKYYGTKTIEVPKALDALLSVMASIAVQAGCNTDNRVRIMSDHLKTNITIELNRARAAETARTGSAN
jgi:hypothetical protein